MKRAITRRRLYPFPIETVWRAFDSADALARWLMPNTFVPTLGHRFEFRTAPAPGFDGIVHCEVLELSPPHRLAFSWVGGGIDTVVQFDLRPTEGGTLVTLAHTGFEGPKGILLSWMLGNGWSGMLNRKLPRAIADIAAGSPEMPADCDTQTTGFWRLFNRAFRRSTALVLATSLAGAAGNRVYGSERSSPLKDMVVTMYAPMAETLVAAADLMPEDKYEFRATADVRSFGQMIAHVAGSQFLYCAAASGQKLDSTLAGRLARVRPYSEAPSTRALTMTRSELIALLKEGIDYCRGAHDAIAEATVLQPVKFGARSMPRLQAFLENVAHNNEHYGNLVAYLRVNGLVPPSTAQRAR
jgi:uncharacterized protein YndB with AHSA1/START domain/uncharacterized damage-inducible protein DinB